MNPRCLGFALALSLTGLPLCSRGGVLDFLLPQHELEVLTHTEMTEDGRKRRAPSPAKPEYYVAVSLGFRDLGGVMGGIKAPPKNEVYQAMAAALAKQGFLPATDRTPPPTLLLAFTWGTLNADLEYGFNPDQPPRQVNRRQILKYIGGYSTGFSDADFDPYTAPVMGLQTVSTEARDLYDLAAEDFYIAAVAAYDLAALRQKQMKKLWITRIGSPSLGFSLPDVMPKIIAIGGVNFGHETSHPVRIRANDKYKPNVTLGDLQVLEFLKPAPKPDTPAEQPQPPAQNGPGQPKH